MKQRFLNSVLLFILLAAGSCPLCAQSRDKVETISPGTRGSTAWSDQSKLSLQDFHSGTMAPIRFVLPLRVNTDLWTRPRQTRFSERGWEDHVEFSGTPFRQQVRMPFGTLLGGRISLGGFQSITPMFNVERGLPGGGSLDPWAAIPVGRGGMILPRDENRYGLSLTIFQDAPRDTGKVLKLDEVFSWIAARSLP